MCQANIRLAGQNRLDSRSPNDLLPKRCGRWPLGTVGACTDRRYLIELGPKLPYNLAAREWTNEMHASDTEIPLEKVNLWLPLEACSVVAAREATFALT